VRKLRTFLRYSPWTEAMGSTQKHFKIIEINSLSLRALDVTKMHRNGERCCATVLTKITWARFTNASKHSEINLGVLQNRDVSKTYGDGEQFGAVVLTKIPRARFRNALKSLKSVARHFETEARPQAETESNFRPYSSQRYPRLDLETL